MFVISKIGKLFNLSNTTETLKRSLVSNLNTDNACFFYDVTKHCSNTDINSCIFNYIKKWFCFITKTKRHLDLSFDSMKDVLANSELKISSEIETFEAGDSWIRHDKTRRNFAKELVKLIRFPLLSPAALKMLLKSRSGLLKSSKSRQLVTNMIKNNNKNKLSNDFSNNLQNRHYIQKMFYVINHQTMSDYSEWQIFYELNEGAPAKEMDFVRYRQYEYLTILLLDSTIYLLSSWSSLLSYCTLTKEFIKPVYLPDSHGGQKGICACTFMGKIYIFGGDTGAMVNHTARTCIAFDPKTNKWEKIARLLEARHRSACAVFGGRIILSGGSDYRGSSTSVEVYDHCAKKWSHMPDMLEGRSHHASISIKNKLFMVGGTSKNCEVFDSFSQKFASIKPILPIYRYEHVRTQYAVIGSKIKIFNNDSLDAIVFDTEKEEWLEEISEE